MKKNLLLLLTSFVSFQSYCQCPDLLEAMVNSCGTNEGNNEFVVFTTSASAAVSTYTLNYGSTNPPTVNNLSGSDATTITGTGSVTTTGTCSVINVTSPATVIPAGARVIFIPANLDQNYDVTGLCNGANSLYVVYIKTNANGGSNSSWNSAGTLSNSATTPRYLQVTYSGDAACNGTNAPVKHYTASGNWPVLAGTAADGNFVTWQDTTALYFNNGCTSIIVPITLLNFTAFNTGNSNWVKWQTSQEINTATFTLERSYDGIHFSTIGSQTAAGYSTGDKYYSYLDNNIIFATTYYRLITTDKDGKSSYSKIIKINPSKNGLSIGNVYPVPAGQVLNVEWNSSIKNSASIIVYDMSGRKLTENRIITNAGFNHYNLDVALLQRGTYMVKIIAQDNVCSVFFTK